MAKTTEDLGNSLWTNDEISVFANRENKNNYQAYKKRLEDEYDKNYSPSGNFWGWFGNAMSGGGWNKYDYLKNRGIDDSYDDYAGNIGNYELNQIKNYGREYDKSRLSQLEAGRDLFSGIPIFGDTILSPATQVITAGQDISESGLDKWKNGKRDATSDIGAGIKTAIDIATAGLGGTAGTFGKSLAKGAALGAGYSFGDSLNTQGNDTWSEEGLKNLGISTAVGGVVGGAASGIGYGVDKLATGAQNVRNAANQYNYQEAMQRANAQTTNLLGDGVGGASVVSNPKIDWLKSRGNLAKTKLGQAAQGIGDIASLAKATEYNPLEKIANSKVGQTTSKILSTKTGKVGAGVAGGLLLSKILNGNNSNDTDLSNLSDEELEQLYNYYYGGQ